MTLSFHERARAMLIFEEGLRLKPYHCTAGVLSIGVGHSLAAHPITPDKLRRYQTVGITHDLAMTWLDEDITDAALECPAIFGRAWDTWGDVRKLGCIGWVFQLGPAGVRGFRRTLDAVRQNDWTLASVRMKSSLWAQQTPARSERVIAMTCFEAWPGVYQKT